VLGPSAGSPELAAALRDDPSLAAAHARLGQLLEKEGKAPQAAEYYRRAVLLEPDRLQALRDKLRLEESREKQ
jgi:Tfp pilus assembly protein PilF